MRIMLRVVLAKNIIKDALHNCLNIFSDSSKLCYIAFSLYKVFIVSLAKNRYHFKPESLDKILPSFKSCL